MFLILRRDQTAPRRGWGALLSMAVVASWLSAQDAAAQTASASINLSNGQVFFTADGPGILGLTSIAGNITGPDVDGVSSIGGVEDNVSDNEIGWLNLAGYNLSDAFAGTLLAPGTTEEDLTFFFQNAGSPLTEGIITFLAGFDPDLDGDGDVDGADFLQIQRTAPAEISTWQASYGDGVNPLAGAWSVPEPTSVVLLLAICCGQASARRRRHW